MIPGLGRRLLPFHPRYHPAGILLNSAQYMLPRLFELAVVQIGVEAALRHERLVIPALDDVAVLHDQDAVGILNG